MMFLIWVPPLVSRILLPLFLWALKALDLYLITFAVLPGRSFAWPRDAGEICAAR